LDRMITKTLADIYLRQGHLQEAYEILTTLSNEDPADLELWIKLEDVSQRLKSNPPVLHQQERSAEERIRVLETWLRNIRKRRSE